MSCETGQTDFWCKVVAEWGLRHAGQFEKDIGNLRIAAHSRWTGRNSQNVPRANRFMVY